MKLCTYCKGGHTEEQCPLYARALSLRKTLPKLGSTTFAANPPAPFVGRFGYPNISVGVLSGTEVRDDSSDLDNPRGWSARNLSVAEVAEKRFSLVHSRSVQSVRSVTATTSAAQEVALARKPVTVELSLTKITSLPTVNAYAAPYGPTASLRSVRTTENAHVPRVVDKVTNDTDLLAASGMRELVHKGIDEHYITKLLSVGLLGTKKGRKLVPTRWSITATDDQIGKHHIDAVKQFPLLSEYIVCEGNFMGNYYFVLLLPYSFGYELFETSLRGGKASVGSFAHDYEFFEGRKMYAHNTAGGYYSVRLALSEFLLGLKRQASALVLRFITDDYTLPLGVWVTREAARRAFSSQQVQRFPDLRSALAHLSARASSLVGVSSQPLLDASVLLHKRMTQTSLFSFG